MSSVSSKTKLGVLCREMVSVARVCVDSQMGTLEAMVCQGKYYTEESSVSYGIESCKGSTEAAAEDRCVVLGFV